MNASTVQRIFADRVANVAMANGVLRIRLVALNGDNDFDSAGELILPVKQLPKLIKDLNQTAENILDKHRKDSVEKTRASAKKATQSVGRGQPGRNSSSSSGRAA